MSALLDQPTDNQSQMLIFAAQSEADLEAVQDCMMQVYATSMAMLVTAVVSVLFFGLAPSMQLVLGILTASISLVLYYISPSMLLETRSTRLPK